ncbi:CRE-GCY-7 protein, partial [Aphelenchoides avenae]
MFCFIAREVVVARRIEKRVEFKAEHEAEFRYGLFAIHTSPVLVQHGSLTSHNCFVTDRWQVKIGDYGMSAWKTVSHWSKRDKKNLWLAPEIMRARENMVGTKEGDIYSFAIVCSELITRRPAWNIGEIEYTEEQVLYMIRRGGTPPYRPNLSADIVMVNPAL